MKKIDMSSEAITRRLRHVDQLREFSLSLMRAKKVSDDKNRDNHQVSANRTETSEKNKRLL